MGIWIRSQNKEVLRCCSSLQYSEDASNGHLIIDVHCVVNGHMGTTIMGKYPTKERALQVLDTMQNRMCQAAGMKFTVYLMPTE